MGHLILIDLWQKYNNIKQNKNDSDDWYLLPLPVAPFGLDFHLYPVKCKRK